ncbi:MAG: histidine--tRNA ligase [Oscillospiraceae bacterium]|jgi:histidyl-tRNA synthetase|nr:histidine--tRNA ligase [Oscillospiraceae bacterium]
MITPRTLSGFMELLPADQIRFNAMLDAIRRSFELYGFTPLDTPVIESAEILLAKGGGETEKQIYRFQKGEHDLALRFDLTVPLAKYVAINAGTLAFPFRRYQIGKVYRGERSQRGRYREFYQCDIDVIGDGALGIMSEAEIPSVIYNTFNALGLRGFVIRFNNRKVLSGLFAILGVSDNAADIMRTIDKIDKIGADATRELLITDANCAAETAEQLVALITSKNDPIETLQAFAGRNETFDTGLSELATVAQTLDAFGVPRENYTIDLTIARGLDYYTGTVYETTITKHPEIGSICSGGRYDNLAEYYTSRALPGVGISIGLTRLFYVLSEQGYLNPELPTAPCDVLVLPMTDDFAAAIALCSSLRNAGIRTALYTEPKKFKQKMAYADKLAVPYVAILGEDEIAQGKITLKDMKTGEQTTASAALLIAGLADRVRESRGIKPIVDN